MGNIREGRWDCDQCGSKAIRGRETTCPGCGHPRGEHVRFYLTDTAPVITDPDLIKIAKSGPDWNCEYCGSANRASSEACSQCGTTRGQSKPNPVVTHYDAGQLVEEVKPRRPRRRGYTNTLFIDDASHSSSDHDAERSPGNMSDGITFAHTPISDAATPYLIVGGLVVVIALFLGWMFIPRTVQATVTSLPWTRTIDIQVYRTVREQGWSIPSGGREIMHETAIRDYDHPIIGYDTVYETECHQEQTGTETYACGSRDLGNGFFEDVDCTRATYSERCDDVPHQKPVYGNIPIYDVRYTYEIERWLADHTEETKGDGGEPYWPTFALMENQREGDNWEQYAVVFTDMKKPEKTYSHDTNQAEWQTFSIGQEVKLTVNRIGGVRTIEP